MSRETATGRRRHGAAPLGDARWWFKEGRLEAGASGLCLAMVATLLGLRVATNAPGPMPVALVALREGLVAAGPPLVAATVVLVGLATADPDRRLGLVVAGVFGGLGTVAPAAALPAAAGVVGGGVLATVGPTTSGNRPSAWARLHAGLVLVAVALALGSAVGALDVGARRAGGTLAFLALASLPLAYRSSLAGGLIGGLAALAVLVLGSVAPYTTGAIALVGFGAVGVPLAVIALGVGGGVAAASSGLRRGERSTALGAGLLVVAAVPATTTAAMAAVLGLSVLWGGDV